MFQTTYIPQPKILTCKINIRHIEKIHLENDPVREHHGVFSDEFRVGLPINDVSEIINNGLTRCQTGSPHVLGTYFNKTHHSINTIVACGRVIGYEGGQYGLRNNYPLASYLVIAKNANGKVINTAYPICEKKAELMLDWSVIINSKIM